jgi:large subunit ribosomal protein L28
MPKVCNVCGKGPVFGHSVSHSHKASPKKWKPNLQQVTAQTTTGVRKIWVCTRCLRTGRVKKAT